jgi:hypothetical protein
VTALGMSSGTESKYQGNGNEHGEETHFEWSL